MVSVKPDTGGSGEAISQSQVGRRLNGVKRWSTAVSPSLARLRGAGGAPTPSACQQQLMGSFVNEVRWAARDCHHLTRNPTSVLS